MNDVRAKVAYLQGLAEGLDLDTGSPEGRVLSSMLDVLVEIADEVEEISEAQTSLAEYVEDVDFDLGALEESLYGDEDEGGEVVRFLPESALLEEEDGVRLTCCPECGETLAADAGEIDSGLDAVCPSCGCMVTDEFQDTGHYHG